MAEIRRRETLRRDEWGVPSSHTASAAALPLYAHGEDKSSHQASSLPSLHRQSFSPRSPAGGPRPTHSSALCLHIVPFSVPYSTFLFQSQAEQPLTKLINIWLSKEKPFSRIRELNKRVTSGLEQPKQHQRSLMAAVTCPYPLFLCGICAKLQSKEGGLGGQTMKVTILLPKHTGPDLGWAMPESRTGG